MALRLVVGLPLLLVMACASRSPVELYGQFSSEAPPPREVRVMLEPGYDRPGKEERVSPWLAIEPSEHGSFSAGHFNVPHRQGMPLPQPSFFLGFENEKDVVYGVGMLDGAVQYRTYDAESRERVDRAEVCWRIPRGRYGQSGRGKVVLEISIQPNFDSRKDCLPPGNYTPTRLDPEA